MPTADSTPRHSAARMLEEARAVEAQGDLPDGPGFARLERALSNPSPAVAAGEVALGWGGLRRLLDQEALYGPVPAHKRAPALGSRIDRVA